MKEMSLWNPRKVSTEPQGSAELQGSTELQGSAEHSLNTTAVTCDRNGRDRIVS